MSKDVYKKRALVDRRIPTERRAKQAETFCVFYMEKRLNTDRRKAPEKRFCWKKTDQCNSEPNYPDLV